MAPTRTCSVHSRSFTSLRTSLVTGTSDSTSFDSVACGSCTCSPEKEYVYVDAPYNYVEEPKNRKERRALLKKCRKIERINRKKGRR